MKRVPETAAWDIEQTKETAPGRSGEQAERTPQQPEIVEPTRAPTVPVPKPTGPPSPVAPPLVREVETVLEDGLGDLYRSVDEATQQEFKREGEETARAVADLLTRAKVEVQRIVRLIVTWLRRLPGLSRLFAEQEAKIKTDRLLALQRKQTKDNQSP